MPTLRAKIRNYRRAIKQLQKAYDLRESLIDLSISRAARRDEDRLNSARESRELRSQLSALREENERLKKLPRWWIMAVLNGPFTPTGDGGNDGCVRDVLGRIVADCNGFEARADVIAELLNRASSPPISVGSPGTPND